MLIYFLIPHCSCYSVAKSCPTLQWTTAWTTACLASLSFTVSWSLFKCMSTQVCDVILPSHPLLPPSPPALNRSHYQGLSQWVGSLHQVTKVLEFHSASASVLPMNIQGWFPLGFTSLISLLSKGLSRVFSSITIQKHWFFGAQPSLWSNSHIHTWLLENHRFDHTDLCQQSNVSAL